MNQGLLLATDGNQAVNYKPAMVTNQGLLLARDDTQAVTVTNQRW